LNIKSKLKNLKKGFSIIELILAASIFSLTISAFAGAVIYGQTGSIQPGNRARAIFLAQEGLEAVRNIRDNNFSNLNGGSYGIEIQNDRWELVADPDVIDNFFTREITISVVDEDTLSVTSGISWEEMFRGESNVVLTTYLTNW
jgi:type II secretory pathway pseudopilin PulG